MRASYMFDYLDSRLQAIRQEGGKPTFVKLPATTPGVGNLVDRFRLGWVTDFLQFHFYFIPFDFPWKRYPAFNIADSAICVGVAVLVVAWYVVERRHVSDTA